MKKYQLELRLRRLAAIQIVKHLWHKSQLRLAVKREKDPNDCGPRRILRRRRPKMSSNCVTMEQVHAFISTKIEEFILPEALKDELRFVAASMGQHIRDWLSLIINREHRSVEYEFDKHVDHIQWTCHGTIDQTEVVRTMYKSKILPENEVTFEKLCSYCVDDCIKDLQPKVYAQTEIEITDTCFNISPLRFAFPSILPFYWERYLKNKETIIIRQLKESCEETGYYDYDESYSLNENLMIMSVLAGNYWALRYFWQSLDADQKARTMSKMAVSRTCQQQIEDEWVAKDVEVIVFLLQQLSFYKLDELLIIMLGSDIVINKLLKWPWHSLFLEILEDVWQHHPTFDHVPIILGILSACKDAKAIPNTCEAYHVIFQKIWVTNPFDMVRTLDYEKIIAEAIDQQTISGLNWIINADELRDRRKELVNYALQAFKESYERRDALEEFVNLVLISDEEREVFRSEVLAEYENRKNEI